MGTAENKKEVWQYFFEKPKKNYNKYMFEMVEYPDYLMYDNEKVDSYKGKWNEFFGNDNDIFLEIGCGSGNFTVGNAEKFKDRNYIALELRFKRLVLGARKSQKRHLKNILLSSYPLSITKVALPNILAALLIAEKVTSLIEVKFFSFDEWILENRLTG